MGPEGLRNLWEVTQLEEKQCEEAVPSAHPCPVPCGHPDGLEGQPPSEHLPAHCPVQGSYLNTRPWQGTPQHLTCSAPVGPFLSLSWPGSGVPVWCFGS